MFGFGGVSELMFIFFLAMLIFGPEKLPEIGRMLAKGMAEVRKASNELKRTLNAELAISEQETEARRRAEAPPIAFSPMAPEAPFSPPPPPAPAALAAPVAADPWKWTEAPPAAVPAPAPAADACGAPVGGPAAHAVPAEAPEASAAPTQAHGEGREPLGPASDDGQERLDHGTAAVPEPLDPRSEILPRPP